MANEFSATEIRAVLAQFRKVMPLVEKIDAIAESVVIEKARVEQIQKQRAEMEKSVSNMKAQHDDLAGQVKNRKAELDALSSAITLATEKHRSVAAEHDAQLQKFQADSVKAQKAHDAMLAASYVQHEKQISDVVAQHAQALKDLEKVKAARAELLNSLR